MNVYKRQLINYIRARTEKVTSTTNVYTTWVIDVKKISTAFRMFGVTEHKDREELATKIVADLKKSGVTQTRKKNKIENSLVLRQINAMLRDIKNARKGWWNLYNIVDERNKFGIVLKSA